MRRILIAAILFGALIFEVTAQSNILDKVAAKLPEFIASHPREEVYLFTDKDVYAPGERIWVSGWVSDLSKEGLSNLSQEVTLQLFDADGFLIDGDKYRLQQSKFSGDVRLPENLPLGSYFIVASTPLHTSTSDSYIKPVLVHRFYEGEPWVVPESPDLIYNAGSNATVRLKAFHHDGSPAHRFSFNYKVWQNSRVVSQGQLRTANGAASFSFPVPVASGNAPLILELSHNRDTWKSRHLLKVSSDSLLVSFWPEGGSYLPGVPVKMGFYATLYGQVPVTLQGDIINSRGEIIAKTGTFHPGFGLFPFRAELGENYYLSVTSEQGKGQRIAIPPPNPDRPALTLLTEGEQSVLVDLVSSAPTTSNYALVVSNRFELVWAANFGMEKSARIRIPIDDFDEGIHHIALFSEEGELLAERLWYKGKPENSAIAVTAELSSGSIRVQIDAGRDRSGSKGLISLSVAEKHSVLTQTQGPRFHFAVNAWLVNEISNFDLLFSSGSNLQTALDYFLIANQIKGFSWIEALNFDASGANQGIRSNVGVGGQVVDRRGSAVSNARVSLLNNRDLQVYTAETNDEGYFFYPSLSTANMNDFSFTATDGQGKGNFRVIPAAGYTDQLGEAIKGRVVPHLLDGLDRIFPDGYLNDNPGLARKAPSRSSVAQANLPEKNEAYKSMLLSSTNLMEVIKVIKPYNLQGGQIVFLGTQNSFHHQSGALIVIDGQRMGTSADILNTIAPPDVESINVSLDPMDIQKYTGLNNVGVIEIVTKRGKPQQQVILPQADVDLDRYEAGYKVPAKFLSLESMRSGATTDLRSTLYWEPLLVLDQQGKATFSIPVSSLKSDFVIIIEGADNAGWGTKAVVPVGPILK